MRSFLSATVIGSSDDGGASLYLWECFSPKRIEGLMSKLSRPRHSRSTGLHSGNLDSARAPALINDVTTTTLRRST